MIRGKIEARMRVLTVTETHKARSKRKPSATIRVNPALGVLRWVIVMNTSSHSWNISFAFARISNWY
jgi:hypothetical protein